ncbi:MAG: histidine kinase [Gammaproteobacteria bacterium]|jgi:two-component system, LytTR family, sensor histidine kinase AlgZ
MANTTSDNDCFLPNFCGLRMVFLVVVIAQLFAFVVVLSPSDLPAEGRWLQLGLISLFVQWCTLVSSAVLCLLRRVICHLSDTIVATMSYTSVLLVVWLISEVAYWYVYPGRHSMAHWSFVLRNLAISFLITGPILRYFYVTHQWQRNVRAEAEARLQSLQSRIRPHFLFNSMNTIASLTRTSPEQAETAVEDLADLFRASLRDARQFHSLTEELTLCRRYLEIEGLRLGDRLKVEWEIESLPGDALLPPLLIQPLLENAIYHGIEPRVEGGTIRIRGRQEGKQLHLEITNPVAVNKGASKGNQIAQENIRARLTTLYGARGGMAIHQENEDFTVSLNWPYRNKLDDEDTDN